MSLNNFSKLFIGLLITIIMIPTFFIPTFSTSKNNINNITSGLNSYSFELTPNGFTWPVPGYTRITSYFGKRNSPTKYASSFHQGIDIGAPAGSNLVAVCDAQVVNLGFKGAAGYVIELKSNNLSIFYHHVDPNYIINKNDIVKVGSIIGRVGPKNIYGIKNNPYKDSQGRPTNGATTGPHLHFTIKKDGQAVNPLYYF